MVNSKKMSKSTVAIVLLSLLLVLSLILTATGAWFTDSKTGNGDTSSAKFGTVAIALNDATATGTWANCGVTKGKTNTYVVPGSTYTLEWEVSNTGTEDVYYKVSSKDLKITVGSSTTALTADQMNAAGITVTYKIESEDLKVEEGTGAGWVEGYARTLDAGESETIQVVVTFDGERLTNEVSGVKFNAKTEAASLACDIEFTATVEAIQQANYALTKLK